VSTKVPTFTELLKGAKLPEASHPVCLRADLTAQFEAAERELAALGNKADITTLDGGGPRRRLVQKIEKLQQEMTAGTVEFRLRALPKSKWRALVAAYPPRTGGDGEPLPQDATIGVDREAFLDALIKISVVEPAISQEQWLELIGHSEDEKRRLTAEGKEDEILEGVLTDRQYSDLCDEAWFLNRGEVSVPFSLAVSQLKTDIAKG